MSNHTHNHGPRLSSQEYHEHAKKAINKPRSLPGGNEVTKHAGQKLNVFKYQMYYNIIHQTDIGVDGAVGPEVITAISSHMKATQIFLKELGATNKDGTPLGIDGKLWENTIAAIKEHFGFDIETGIANKVVDSIQNETDKYKNLSDSALFAKLKEANGALPKKIRDKRYALAEFVWRFKRDGNIVKRDSNNVFGIYDDDGNADTFDFSQHDLQIMMVLIGSTNTEVANGWIYEKNIPNNVFDSVVKEYDLKNANGNAWKAKDFDADGNIRTADEVKANKELCIEGINDEINTLEGINKKTKTTPSQKKENRIKIQKLIIARTFVTDKTIFDSDSLDFTRDLIKDKKAIAGSYGDKKMQIQVLDALENGDLKNFLIGQGPRVALTIIGLLLASMLPKYFRGWVSVYIAAIAGLGLYNDAKKAGVDLWITEKGDTNGTNTADVTGNGLDLGADWIQTILTSKPKGLESRHNYVYAHTVKENKEEQIFTERKKLDTAFLYASQDSELAKFDTSKIDILDAGSVMEAVHPYTAEKLKEHGIKGDEFLKLIRLVRKVSTDGANDKTFWDMLVQGQLSEKNNKLSVNWINGYKEINKNINLEVSTLSGIGFGTEWVNDPENIKYQVQNALAKAQPNIFEWAGNQVVGFATASSTITQPSIKEIGKVITKLQTINATIPADKSAINKIGEIYEWLRKTLGATKVVDDYLEETDNYTRAFPWTDTAISIANSASKGISGVISYFGISPTYAPGLITETTPKALEDLIKKWEPIARDIDKLEIPAETKAELQKKTDAELLKLRNMLAALYGELANNASISAAQRGALEEKWKDAIINVLNTNPTKALEDIEAQKAQMQNELWQQYTNLWDYADALFRNANAIKWIQTLVALDPSKLTDPNAKKVQNIAKEIINSTAGSSSILETFKGYVTARKNSIKTHIPTSVVIGAQDLAALRESEKKNAEAENEILSGTALAYIKDLAKDHLGVDTNDHTNVLTSIEDLVRKIDGSTYDLEWDTLKGSIEGAKTAIQARKEALANSLNISIAELVDVENNQAIDIFTRNVKDARKRIEDTIPAGPVRDRKLQKTNEVISKGIDTMVAKLATYWDNALDEIAALEWFYNKLNGSVGNGENKNFETELAKKYSEITKEKLLQITIKDAPPGISGPLEKLLETYKDNHSVRDAILEVIEQDSNTMEKVLGSIDLIIEGLKAQENKDAEIADLEWYREAIIQALQWSIPASISRWLQSTSKNTAVFLNALIRA